MPLVKRFPRKLLVNHAYPLPGGISRSATKTESLPFTPDERTTGRLELRSLRLSRLYAMDLWKATGVAELLAEVKDTAVFCGGLFGMASNLKSDGLQPKERWPPT